MRGSGRVHRQLAFNGHVNVVPAGDERLWKHPPWESIMENGRIYGRGSCDMKAGLAASIFAVKALIDSDIEITSELLIESVIGEESGGIGTLSTILRGYTPDAVVICEPTNLNLLISQCGCLMFRIRIHGKAAHGAFGYLGVSAVEESLPILNGLLNLEEKRGKERSNPLYSSVPNAVPLSIGTVRAGNWDSTVPEEFVAEGRYGVWPGETLDHAKREFERTVRKIAFADSWLRQHPPEVDWYGPQWESCEISQDHWLPRLVSDSYRQIFGVPPRIGGEQAGTDMRLFTNIADRPAVLFGPGDISVAHFRDEYVLTKDVVGACKTYALSALRWEEANSHLATKRARARLQD